MITASGSDNSSDASAAVMPKLPVIADTDQHIWVDNTRNLGWEYYLIDDGWKRWNGGGPNAWNAMGCGELCERPGRRRLNLGESG
jgi:hypothetical protein